MEIGVRLLGSRSDCFEAAIACKLPTDILYALEGRSDVELVTLLRLHGANSSLPCEILETGNKAGLTSERGLVVRVCGHQSL